jgi:hypothetical protein
MRRGSSKQASTSKAAASCRTPKKRWLLGPPFATVISGGNPVRILTFSILFILCGAFAVEAPSRAGQVTPAQLECGSQGTPLAQTTLYFGLSRKSGNVTASEWKAFLSKEVTPRFPQGFTVWEADGQWRKADNHIARERSKVLVLLHDESPDFRKNVSAIIDTYKRVFEQESVLWETAHVCASF